MNRYNKDILTEEFTTLTTEYVKSSNLKHRKELGQYFTPKSIRETLLRHLPLKKGLRILDPACGTGEFLISAKQMFPGSKLFGLEIDEKLIDISRHNISEAHIISTDSLTFSTNEQFDFIIGNPPYFEFSPEPQIKNKYLEVIGGRPNIFALFIKLGIDLLNEGGYLAFVVPPSMNNGAYFSNLRNYIICHTNIEYLHILDDPNLFHLANQSTMLLVLKKGKNKEDYIFRKNGSVIFSQEPSKLNSLFRGKLSLKDLGFRVKTGNVVWNQHKQSLTNDPSESTRLIWSHNITPNGLDLEPSRGKPPYVRVNRWDIGPAIVVNRIVGQVNKGSLKAALIEPGVKFVGENHVNVIQDILDTTGARLRWLLEQLKDEDNLKCVQMITGNTQISKTELETLFPIKKRSLAEGTETDTVSETRLNTNEGLAFDFN